MDELIIPASYFYLLYLYVFNDFQIGSLQKIHKFIFFIFQNRAGELIGMNDQDFPDTSVIQLHIGTDLCASAIRFMIGINNSTSYLSRLFSKFPKICNGVSALR